MFHYEPPSPGSSVNQWRRWIRRETYKSYYDGVWDALFDAISIEGLPDVGVRKVDGCWRQCPSLGFVDATQEREAAIIRMKRDDTKRGQRSKAQKEARRKKSRKNAKRRKTQAQQKAAAARRDIKG